MLFYELAKCPDEIVINELCMHPESEWKLHFASRQDLTIFAIQAIGPDGRWTRKPLAYRESNNFHLRVRLPPEICVNLVFKHIHAASSYTIRRQIVPFICENEYFLISNPHWSFTNLTSYPLVLRYIMFLEWEKHISINIFIPIQHLRTSVWSPLNLLVSRVVKPHSFRRSS